MTADTVTIRLGTRGSPLAIVQAEIVRDALLRDDPAVLIEIVPISTTGDRVQGQRLAAIGGKGLFVKEIEAALDEDRIDAAVHSMKDVETWFEDRFVIPAILEREDPRDAFISPRHRGIDDLPKGARVGTASLRRQAQLLARRPDIEVVLIRGNVNTRLAKLERGEAEATFLAEAGLIRLGLAIERQPLDPGEMVPSAAQGAVGVECRTADEALVARLARLDHAETRVRVEAERALLAALDGSCRTPIGAYAVVGADGSLSLDALLARPDGSAVWRTSRTGAAADAAEMGRDAGAELRRDGDRNLLQ